jgi:hypothetical protein
MKQLLSLARGYTLGRLTPQLVAEAIRWPAGLGAAAVLVWAAAASAQVGPVGQTNGGAINQAIFNTNSDAAGFNAMSLTPALVVPATSTAQATFTTATGAVATGTVIVTKTTVITTCSATTGVTLPALQRYEAITIINRSGGSCLIWPSVGATVETALGTDSAANAPFTMLTNTDVIFKPVSATKWVQ